MEAQKMTIHRALSELKLIDAKITKQITELQPVAINQRLKKISGHITEEDFKTNVTSSYNSITDLIDRKLKIKSKIVESNSITQITVSGKTFTVADAITFKKIIEAKKSLSAMLKQRLTVMVGHLNKNNEQINANADNLALHVVGNDVTKKNDDQAVSTRKAYVDNNEFHLVDPLKIQDKINALEDETSKFETEVDAVLSESNAVTTINI